MKPGVEVSEAMEAVGSEDIALGFNFGVHMHGVSSRAPSEKGESRNANLRRDIVTGPRGSPDYPYVGSILEGIAADYDRQALRQDNQAELEERLGN